MRHLPIYQDLTDFTSVVIIFQMIFALGLLIALLLLVLDTFLGRK